MVTEKFWLAFAAVAGAVTAISTAAMAIAIIVTALYAKRTLQATKDDSRARTRPVLVAYLERELLSPGTILLEIKNFGRSTATDVRVSFDPPAPPLSEVEKMPDADVAKWLYEQFAEAIPAWAPGWSTSNVVRAGQDQLQAFGVVLSYAGPDGTRYDERFRQLPAPILGTTTATPSQAKDPITLGQQGVGALQALVRTMRTR